MTLRRTLLVSLGVVALVGAVAATLGPQDRKLVQHPDVSKSEIELLHAQPFQLDTPYINWWRAEQPLVASGYVLVLASDPELVRPRQVAEPVLYVGAEIAERLNAGTESGNLVVLVPAPVDANNEVVLDPTSVPIWFGPPELPERIGAGEILRQLDEARRLGVGAAGVSDKMAATAAPGTIYAKDRNELDLALADLIEEYSPTETDLVGGMRVPLTR